jgi:hypothetical protein
MCPPLTNDTCAPNSRPAGRLSKLCCQATPN